MKIKYQAGSGEWLCFKHAVQWAQDNVDIIPVADEDDFSSEYDLRDTSCFVCNGKTY
ncbi:hypothetical protein D3C79_1068840 [compost metagenome]